MQESGFQAPFGVLTGPVAGDLRSTYVVLATVEIEGEKPERRFDRSDSGLEILSHIEEEFRLHRIPRSSVSAFRL
jgi:hypothetical protein